MEALTPDRVAELRKKLDELEALSNLYYGQAVQIGVHSFIEITGVLNELIKIFRRSLKEGIDFSLANRHTDVPLLALPHNIRYLGEKLECIFEPFAHVSMRPRKD